MKRLILAVIGLGALIGLGFYVNQPKPPAISRAETGVEPTPEQTMEQPQPTTAVAAKTGQFRAASAEASAPGQAPSAPSAAPDMSFVFGQAIETLVSAQAGYEQKQAAWKRLKETGNLDQAIRELEQRVANDPRTAEYSAALGQAYLKKCALIEDVREQAVLAMKADQLLEAALSLDPSNWEARFTKAVGMSYWPAQLNKGQEVIEQFHTLIEQQEAQPPQPQFAAPTSGSATNTRRPVTPTMPRKSGSAGQRSSPIARN